MKLLEKMAGKMDGTYAAVGVAAGLALSGWLLQKTILAPAKKTTPQVVLVTGASSGIGKATALKLLQEGHVVYGAARRVDRMKDLEEAGGHAIAMDVVDETQVVAAVQRILSEQDRIDCLINNAGYAIYGAVEDITIAEARRQFEVNIFGLARLTQEVLPHMRRAKSGTIINTCSMGGKIYTTFGAWYHATKHALEGWSDCLRLELHQFGIKVVIMEPGLIATEFGDVMMDPMIQRSKGGAYEETITTFVKNSKQSAGIMSPPSVIANAMADAVVRKHPPRRYLVGSMAKPLVYFRNWFGDGVYDSFMLANLK